MAVSFAAFGLIAGAILSGRILEILGARLCAAVSLAAIGVFGTAGMVPSDANLLLASRFVVGFAAGCLTTACIWVIVERYELGRRATVFGISASMGSVSSLVGLLLGGWIAQEFGWRATFIQFAVLAGVGLMFTLVGIPHSKPLIEAGNARAGPGYLRRLWPSYLLAAFVMALVFMGSNQFGFLLDENGIKSIPLRSGIIAAITLNSAIFSALYGPVQLRLDPQRTFILSLAILCASFLTVGTAHGTVWAVIGASGMGIFGGLSVPYVMHRVTLLATPCERGRAIGALTVCSYTGAFLNPLMLAPLRTACGLPGVFVITGAVIGLFAVGAGIRWMVLRPQGVAAPAP
jgi:MFS family permease